MDPAHRGWPPGPGGHSSNAEQQQNQSQPPRSGGSYGSGTPQHQPHQSPPSAQSSLPPPGPYQYHNPSHSGLASLAGISQSSPRQPSSSHRQDGGQGPGYALPGLSQATGQPSGAERERERERERAREAETHIKEEDERRYREERQRLEQVPPHQAQSGQPIHLHQPVAVGPRTVHGPNGLLGNSAHAGPGQGPQPQLPLGAPSGPGNIFAGGPVQPGGQPQSSAGQPMQQALLMPFAPNSQPQGQQQMGQGQGQQPILNDALSYLDQVKVQFADHPDVYNRFLDIMKDFKSGAIDTPGVIGRVSQLFAGNPELIQGFNTFLPPGYRIECGTGDDPNAIRVTTPMGTTVQSMPQPRPLSRQEGPVGERPPIESFTPQPGPGAQMMFSPSGRPAGPAVPGQGQPAMDAARQQEQQAMHQQEQRGVTQLQNAISMTGNNPAMRAGLSPRSTPMPGQEHGGMAGDAQGQAGMEKRGPVEFNHAISYVNKIKNRFSAHPDIYKQFLEILQTYQRESKPIQDVYSQVTHLFKTAPDLLEDFKQFLPESAAQAKAAERARQQAEENAVMSNVRNEGGGMYGSPVMNRDPTMGTPSHGRGLPPVGNFAPTPISKDNKRKRNERQGTAGSLMEGANGATGKAPIGAHPSKRVKGQMGVRDMVQQPPQSPTLIPALPAPIAPTTTSAATSEELGFFDRAKKAIANKNTMNEFLKLCNLFSQDLIDRSTLVYRARSFIGGHPELMKWFNDFVGYDEREVNVDNKARIPTGRVSLSNCRGLGPSYRLLPKRERQKPCSGRDELCNSVLNDEWASHPTWASEDSGFIAHRKNVHEEGLHRIEEERHDYDYNIEACSRTIQLLEPLAQQLRRMSDADQHAFKLPPGLGGQSETIYKRVIMKLYGRDKGHEVIEQLHRQPYQVIPVLLNRLKERLETWKMAQREWEKVWREQTQKMFWRSLDHQAVNAGRNDKRQFQTKQLQTDISNIYDAMRKQENAAPGALRKPQMSFQIDDMETLVDATVLVLAHVDYSLAPDHPRLNGFIKEFVPLFFGMDEIAFRAQLQARLGDTPPNEAADDLVSGAEDSGSGRGRKGAGKNGNLLRTALGAGRGGKIGRKDREDSTASGSRASTPDVASNAGDDDIAMDITDDAEGKASQSTARWFEHPVDDNASQRQSNVDPNEAHKRHNYRLWANTPMYCFIRMFVILYERLAKLKAAEAEARDVVTNGLKTKPANDLGIIDKVPTDFFSEVGPTANFYLQMLAKFEDFLRGDIEFLDIEETLRRYYLQSGYHLYAFEKMIQAIGRFGISVLNGEGKDKSWEIYQLFKRDRTKDTTTAPQQADYRKAVEKMIREGDLYKIDYDQPQGKMDIYLARKDSPSYFDDGLSPLDQENRWRSYIATFQTVDPTDGVDQSKISLPFLYRNMRTVGVDPKSHSYPPSPPAGGDSETASATSERLTSRIIHTKNEENLVLRVAVNTYKCIFQKQTQEAWAEPFAEREGGREGVEQAYDDAQHREEVMRESYVMNNEGMKGLSREDVDQQNGNFAKICAGEEVGAAETAAPAAEAAEAAAPVEGEAAAAAAPPAVVPTVEGGSAPAAEEEKMEVDN